MLTRVMHSPSVLHLKQLKHLLRYINGTKSSRMTYHRDHSVHYGMDFTFLCGVDSSHANDEDTARSTGGWFVLLRQGQGSVCAKSGQTDDVALSSTESETIWACSVATQGAYIKQFLEKLIYSIKSLLISSRIPSQLSMPKRKTSRKADFVILKLSITTCANYCMKDGLRWLKFTLPINLQI
jgi:hypothetical protein